MPSCRLRVAVLDRLLAVLTLAGGIGLVAPSRLAAQAIDAGFNLQANAELYALAVQPDGRILVGGNFSAFGSTNRSRIARLNPDGTIDAGFNPNASSTVNAIVVQPDGKILVGGFFNLMGGQPRPRLVRLNADGTLDNGFEARIDNNSVQALALQADGRILVGGSFTSIGGVARNGLARLNADGSLEAAFDPGLGGSFSSSGSNVTGFSLLPEGRILIAGNFTSVSGQDRLGVARLGANGVLDLTFVPPVFLGSSRGTLPLAGGKCLVFGGVLRGAGSEFQYLVRLNVDGSLDSSFTPPALNGSVFAVAQQADGKFVLGGSMTRVAGTARGGVIRLQTDGALDSTFTAEIAGILTSVGSTPYVFNLAIPPGPLNILAVGSFTTVSGQPHSGLVRFGTPLPTVSRGPVDVTAGAGATVTLTASADGPDVRYQWMRNGQAILGATRDTLVLAGLQAASAGLFTVTLSNPWGTVTTAPATVAVGVATAPAYSVVTLAGQAGQTGHVDGTGAGARFDHPTGVAVDAAGNLYCLDTTSNFLRRVTPDGVVSTLAVQAGLGLAIDATGGLCVADGFSRVLRVTPAGVTSIVAGTLVPGALDGPAASAQFRGPTGVAVDGQGIIYVADTGNLTVRRIRGDVVTTLAGKAGVPGTEDGSGEAARFAGPGGLALDAAGNLYVADRTRVRRVTPGGVVTTVAVVEAVAVAVDMAGLVYASDALAHVVRRIGPDGSVAILAGSPGIGGAADGAAGNARFLSPWGLAFDRNGNLLVADNGNATVRRISPGAAPLAITVPPEAAYAEAGATGVVTVGAQGGSLTYQWKKDGVVLPGATRAAYVVNGVQAAADMGYYSVVVSSGGSSVESAEVLLTVANPEAPGRLVNVATRGLVPPGGALTPGFVVRGGGPKQLVVRAVGPSLLRFGVGGVLADPRLALAPLGGGVTLANDDWSTGGTALVAATAAVGGFPLDAGSRDAAALAVLATGGAYTVRVSGPDATSTGVALAEVYDADPITAGSQLANVSTMGLVGTGSNSLVPGFVIGGGGPLQLLIRAIGPGLAPFGVTGVLADPQLQVIPAGRTAPIAANDNWGGGSTLTAAFAAAGAFGLTSDSKDAALLVRLPPGAYYVIVGGGGASGVALVEIYDVP